MYEEDVIYSPNNIRASQCDQDMLCWFSNSTPFNSLQLKYFFENSTTFGVIMNFFSIFVLSYFSVLIVFSKPPGKYWNKS